MSDKIIGHFKSGTFYTENASDIITGSIQQVKRNKVDERNVDANCKENLLALGFSDTSIELGKTGISSIDANIISKGHGGKKGKLDVCVILDNHLVMVIEDKTPSETVDKALEESIYYCNGLLNKNAADIRIAVGYNGKEVKWRVRTKKDTTTGQYTWEPFLIKGSECKNFPSPELVSLIYRHNELTRITEDRSSSSKKALNDCIYTLKIKYRQLSFIQNDNATTIDFTIAFISLKSILEKHGDIFPKQEWKWNGLPGSDNESLRENIKGCVEYICASEARAKEAKTNKRIDLAKNFSDIFHQKNKNRSFDFAGLIEDFSTTNQLDALHDIYVEITKLPALHSSQIDLFGETYELLASKQTKQMFGQYFTGRHIIRPLVRMLLEGETTATITGGIKNNKAQHPKKICDPACGTGGFLTEAFKHIKNIFGDTIDADDFAKQAFFGYDIFGSNVTKTKINLYLAGDGYSELEENDTLKGNIPHQFDYIVTIPPYGAGSAGATVDASVINSTRLEVNFLIRIVMLLKEGGKALIIIPDGIFESPSLSPLRAWLIKQCQIDKIVGLPKFAFAPYTKEKTYAIFLVKRGAPLEDVERAANEEIWFYIVDNDGYANSDKRFPTGRKDADGKWLHDEFSDWTDKIGEEHECALIVRWQQKEQAPGERFIDEWGNEISGKKYGRIKVSEVLKQEYASYETIPKSAALKVVQSYLTPGIENVSEEDLKRAGVFICNDKEKGRIYKSGGKETNKIISESTALKKVIANLKTEGAIPSNSSDLFEDDGSVKAEFNQSIEEQQIVWDEEDQQFYDQSRMKIVKLMNLLPEKYFREPQVERIPISDFKADIDQIEADFTVLLSELAGNAGA